MKPTPSIQISIPNPCHEDWDKMTPQQHGRFCDSCQKCVVDFTGFTDEELYKFFQQHQGQKVCGRFRNTQLNKAITLSHQPHSKLYHWLAAAGIVLFTVVATGTTTFAKPPLTASIIINESVVDDTTSGKKDAISGQVYDNNNEPVIAAVIHLLKNGVIVNSAISDYDGFFSMDSVTQDADTIRIQCNSYTSRSIALYTIKNPKEVKIKLETIGVLPEVAVVGYAVPLIDNSLLPPVKNPGHFVPPRPSFWYRITHPFRKH